jgi:hypothetical protein
MAVQLLIDSLRDEVLRVPLKPGHSRNKTLCHIFQERSIGLDGSIAKTLLDHVSAPTELLSWLEHEKVEPSPTHSEYA